MLSLISLRYFLSSSERFPCMASFGWLQRHIPALVLLLAHVRVLAIYACYKMQRTFARSSSLQGHLNWPLVLPRTLDNFHTKNNLYFQFLRNIWKAIFLACLQTLFENCIGTQSEGLNCLVTLLLSDEIRKQIDIQDFFFQETRKSEEFEKHGPNHCLLML